MLDGQESSVNDTSFDPRGIGCRRFCILWHPKMCFACVRLRSRSCRGNLRRSWVYAPLLLLSMLKISSSHLNREFDFRPLQWLCCVGLVALAVPLTFAVPAKTRRPIVSIWQSPRLCSLVLGRPQAFLKFRRSPSQAGSKSKVQSLMGWNCSCLLNLMRMNQSLVQDCSFCKNCCHAHDPCLSERKKANARNLQPASYLVICNLTLCPLSHSAGAWLHGALVSRSRGLCCESWEQLDQLFCATIQIGIGTWICWSKAKQPSSQSPSGGSRPRAHATAWSAELKAALVLKNPFCFCLQTENARIMFFFASC